MYFCFCFEKRWISTRLYNQFGDVVGIYEPRIMVITRLVDRHVRSWWLKKKKKVFKEKVDHLFNSVELLEAWCQKIIVWN